MTSDSRPPIVASEATDRRILSVIISLKILTLSGFRRLYLRHFAVRYGLVADICCALSALLLMALPATAVSSVQYVALLALELVVLCLLRGFILPGQLTTEGVEEVIASKVVEREIESVDGKDIYEGEKATLIQTRYRVIDDRTNGH